mmetsp:Transcript_55070/g.133796  ORF Transcript_55070/g.133796 Transcript_55070/m.133796 type:complete len:204 (+) Transcript_55070:602-1213(+)
MVEDKLVDMSFSVDTLIANTCCEICTPLGCEGHGLDSTACTVSAFKSSCVERYSLVPRMDGVVVTVFDGAGLLTVVKSILELADNIHVSVHVCRTLLDGLLLTGASVVAEVSITVGELRRAAVKGSCHPFVGIVGGTVVVTEHLERFVRTVGALVHLLLCTGREALDGSLVVVVREGVVRVLDASHVFDDDSSCCFEATICVG